MGWNTSYYYNPIQPILTTKINIERTRIRKQFDYQVSNISNIFNIYRCAIAIKLYTMILSCTGLSNQYIS